MIWLNIQQKLCWKRFESSVQFISKVAIKKKRQNPNINTRSYPIQAFFVAKFETQKKFRLWTNTQNLWMQNENQSVFYLSHKQHNDLTKFALSREDTLLQLKENPAQIQ